MEVILNICLRMEQIENTFWDYPTFIFRNISISLVLTVAARIFVGQMLLHTYKIFNISKYVPPYILGTILIWRQICR